MEWIIASVKKKLYNILYIRSFICIFHARGGAYKCVHHRTVGREQEYWCNRCISHFIFMQIFNNDFRVFFFCFGFVSLSCCLSALHSLHTVCLALSWPDLIMFVNISHFSMLVVVGHIKYVCGGLSSQANVFAIHCIHFVFGIAGQQWMWKKVKWATQLLKWCYKQTSKKKILFDRVRAFFLLFECNKGLKWSFFINIKRKWRDA